MGTLTLPASQSGAPSKSGSGYWMFSQQADLGWFAFSLAVPLVLYLVPYLALGSKAVWPLYMVYVAFFATPHLWMTWAVTLPETGRANYSKRSFIEPLAVTLTLVASVPLAARLGAWDWLFTAVTLIGVWHIFRQHTGLLKIYDAKYAQVHQDSSIFADMKPFHWLCMLAFNLPILYVWTMPPIHVVVGFQKFQLWSPDWPRWVLGVGAIATLSLAIPTIRNLLRRQREGKPFPAAHMALALTAGLSYLVAFAVVPPQDYLLTLAIFISYHDLQYIGFVWNFQQKRSRVEQGLGTRLDVLHRWALEGRFWPSIGVAFGFSAVVLGLIMVSPPTVALAMGVFHNVIHYWMDGFVWQRKHNAKLSLHMGLR